MNTEMRVENWPISKLKPAEYNPRVELKPGDEEFDNIQRSIEQWGLVEPIVVNSDGTIIGGHQRYNVLKHLGYSKVQVSVVDLKKNDEKALNVALNNLSGSWDDEKLYEVLKDLDLDNYDFSITGFKKADMETLEIQLSEDLEAFDDDFDYDAEPAENRGGYTSQPGDVWLLGKHRLMCGSSADADDMRKLMAGEKANLVFTDPPYGVAIGSKNEALNEVQRAGRCIENIEGDTLSEEELYTMLKDAFTNVRENCRDDASYFITSPQGGSLGLMMMTMMRDAGLPVRHVLMWEKNTATFSLGRLDYDYQHEPMFYTWTEKHRNFRKGKFRTTVWKVDKPRKCDLHPTMKPIELIAQCILDGTLEGESVLDAFGGSGSTLITCEQLNRKCFMMEIDPKYCDVIINRWEKLTGERARLEV